MTGGGFAGSAAALIDSSRTAAFFAHMRERWKSERGVDPDLWTVHPFEGASTQILWLT
jgi:galactokinase